MNENNLNDNKFLNIGEDITQKFEIEGQNCEYGMFNSQ